MGQKVDLHDTEQMSRLNQTIGVAFRSMGNMGQFSKPGNVVAHRG